MVPTTAGRGHHADGTVRWFHQIYLMEAGLELWLALLRHSTDYNEGVHNLFPRIPEMLETDLDNLKQVGVSVFHAPTASSRSLLPVRHVLLWHVRRCYVCVARPYFSAMRESGLVSHFVLSYVCVAHLLLSLLFPLLRSSLAVRFCSPFCPLSLMLSILFRRFFQCDLSTDSSTHRSID